MKRFLAMTVAAWFFALSLTGCARARIMPAEPSLAVQPVSLAPPLARPPLGEELAYEISWWGVPVGTATLAALKPAETEHEGLVRLTCEARSNWVLAVIHPVRVQMTSFVHPDPLSPRRFESFLKRRWEVHESVITFDPASAASLHQLPEGKTVTVPATPQTQDGLSMLYYIRTVPLQLGKTVPLQVTADGRNWDLKGEVVRAGILRIGRIGEWPVVEGQGEMAYPVPFFHGATARVWMSADEYRIPLMAKINSRIGPVTVVLTRRTISPESE